MSNIIEKSKILLMTYPLMRGERVKEVQAAIQALGYDLGPCGADGIYGKATKAAVLAFQQEAGMAGDGVVDEATFSAIGGCVLLRAQRRPGVQAAAPSAPALSVWMDQSGADWRRYRQAHLEALQALGVTRVAVMLASHKDKVSWDRERWPFGYLEEFCSEMRAVGIEPIVTVWARPIRDYQEQLLGEIGMVAPTLGAMVELDAEKQWAASKLKGYLSLEEAAEVLRDELHRRGTQRVGCTVVSTAMRESLSALCDEVAVQCYSTNQYSYTGPWGPGKLQGRAIDAWKRSHVSPIEGDDEREAQEGKDGLKRLIVGLPAYWQEPGGQGKWPEAECPWGDAYRVCRVAGVHEVRYWSWMHLVGRRGTARGDAWRALAGLRGR